MRASTIICCLTSALATCASLASAQTVQRQTVGPIRSARVPLPVIPPMRKLPPLSTPKLTTLAQQLLGDPQVKATETKLHFETLTSQTEPEVFLFNPLIATKSGSTVIMGPDSAAGFRLRAVNGPPITGKAMFVCSVKADQPMTWSAFSADAATMIGGPVEQTADGAVFAVDLATIEPIMPVRIQSSGGWQFSSCDVTIFD